MGVATGAAAQASTLTLERLFQHNARPLRQQDHLGAGDLQQSAVAGVGDDLLLHRAVHNDPLAFLGLDRVQGHGRLLVVALGNQHNSCVQATSLYYQETRCSY